MDDKLVKTVTKTVEAMARIERFVEKYGSQLNAQQVAAIERAHSSLHEAIKAAKQRARS